ncbi:DJ-1/PfpI family protein [Streptococcus agalactiae]|uniref:DJ-1/PfpI family protein n=1 Tax=Streptococcus agalactiae TaxID=1311 RepID=UPI003C782B16
MKKVYMYVQDTMADWEHGYLMQALTLQSFLSKKMVSFHTVGKTLQSITTASGIRVVPEISLKDIDIKNTAALILIGGDTWLEEDNSEILDIASQLLQQEILVAAICGATLGLADRCELNTRFHTSNASFYPEMSSNYTGQKYYSDDVAVSDGNLITASSAGSLLWAKLIIENLGLYSQETSEAWFDYFSTGNIASYSRLMYSFSKEGK